MRQTEWIGRSFNFSFPAGVLPGIIERLRGTPVRIQHLVEGIAPDKLKLYLTGGWSMQEHVGHLGDLEELWSCRLGELLVRKEALCAADVENRKTKEAQHNNKAFAEVFDVFCRARNDFVHRLEALTEEEASLTSLHPRLRKPMRIVDLAYFTAEHDDHHLARIYEIVSCLKAKQ